MRWPQALFDRNTKSIQLFSSAYDSLILSARSADQIVRRWIRVAEENTLTYSMRQFRFYEHMRPIQRHRYRFDSLTFGKSLSLRTNMRIANTTYLILVLRVHGVSA